VFSLREYLITIAEGCGSTISYDEKWVHDKVQEFYRATLTWGKNMRMREIIDMIFPKVQITS